MKIKSVQIANFRKIHDIKINMEDDITVIAGANNSGKTSLVELFNSVFGNSKGRLCYEDFPAMECQRWSNSIYPKIQTAYGAKKSKEETISDICALVSSDTIPSNATLMPPIEIKIQVDYKKDEDDIRHFADYIMELDLSNTSFYFIYRYALNISQFRKNIDSEYEKFSSRFSKLTGDATCDAATIRIIKEMLVLLYAKASDETAYFSDKSYSNVVKMEISSFKNLFNYHNIMAGRTLDDESSDRTRVLTKNMIDIASKEDDWKDFIRDLPDQILQPIQDAGIQEKVRSTSLDTLRSTMDSVSKTNGGHAANIVIDMNVTEEAIYTLLKSITNAKYQAGDHYLRESSQGLGYSNLIYIHLQLEKYKKTIDPLIVNFFVIEEPEAHMHPPMQNIFARYLFDYYKQKSGIQGVLTTHSHEVVRIAEITQLRVLRQISLYECNLYDLREFQNSIMSSKHLLDFYDWFYTINFPDIIFADKIIMYEGDTERMLIKSILRSKEFESLRNQYLSFVQVGGAYAFNYRPIVKFLNIKTVLITDLDYDKNPASINEILLSGTTNSAINNFAELSINDSAPTIQKLYDWQTRCKPIVVDGIIYLAFQSKCDGYARTLEEAMLARYYKITVLDVKTKDEWKKLRDNDKLKFTIPRGDGDCNLHTIVLHTSNGKTDFMYSVILNGLVDSMLPSYIKEALLWLAT